MSWVLQLNAENSIALNSIGHVAMVDFDDNFLDGLLVLEGQCVLNVFVVSTSNGTGSL